MLSIDPWRSVRRLPVLMLVGFALMAVGGVGDVVVHATAAPHHGHAGFDLDEHLTHLAGVIGMVLVLAAVVARGLRGPLRQRASVAGGIDRNAHR